MKQSQKVTIYTDGACDPNPGRGGWGAVVITSSGSYELYGCEDDTTNNRMELTAAVESLGSLDQPSQVTIYTDSQYLQKGIKEWLPRWIKRNWRTTSGKVANRDLWQALLDAEKPHQISWAWVKGHAGDQHNQRADYLARKARM
jgi:ribonuclease HI